MTGILNAEPVIYREDSTARYSLIVRRSDSLVETLVEQRIRPNCIDWEKPWTWGGCVGKATLVSPFQVGMGVARCRGYKCGVRGIPDLFGGSV